MYEYRAYQPFLTSEGGHCGASGLTPPLHVSHPFPKWNAFLGNRLPKAHSPVDHNKIFQGLIREQLCRCDMRA